MRVYECLVFGIPELPEEVISEDLVDFVETAIQKREAFKIKIIPEGTAKPERINSGAIGYYPPYGMAYVSNPESEWGLAALDTTRKMLIFDADASAFNRQRDAIVFSQQPTNTYVQEPYKAVLQEFLARGYTIVEYALREPGDYITRHKDPAELHFGAKLSIDALLQPNNQL